MKRLVMMAVLATVLLVTSIAQAADYGLYVAGRAGYGIVMDVQDDTNPDAEATLDAGYNFGLALGVDLGLLRAEGEITYAAYDFDQYVTSSGTTDLDGDATAFRVMANVYHDFTVLPILSPYVGVGLGYLKSESEIKGLGATIEDDSDEFAFQFMAGVGVELTDEFIVDVGYRFFGTSELDEELMTHDLVVGIRYVIF